MRKLFPCIKQLYKPVHAANPGRMDFSYGKNYPNTDIPRFSSFVDKLLFFGDISCFSKIYCCFRRYILLFVDILLFFGDISRF